MASCSRRDARRTHWSLKPRARASASVWRAGFDDGGDDSDRDEWDVDDEYDSDEEDDGYGRHRSDHGSGWGV